ncbi:hypothetical protein Scep_021753 [Stephania cephalantha]|uniref:Uncharacterized protein n=1 Tax=Stephania cephalantha TaxID=152367 RepID=A0AAP0I240_9MAGN
MENLSSSTGVPFLRRHTSAKLGDSLGGKRGRSRCTQWRGRTEEAHTVERANRGGAHGGERGWKRRTRWRGKTEEAHTVERADGGGAHGGEGEQRRRIQWRLQTKEAHTVERADEGALSKAMRRMEGGEMGFLEEREFFFFEGGVEVEVGIIGLFYLTF